MIIRNPKMTDDLQVIKEQNNDETNWIVSWGGYNPTADMCVTMKTEDDAWNLYDYLNNPNKNPHVITKH